MRHVGHKSNFKCMHLPFLCLLSDATKESSPMPVLPAASLSSDTVSESRETRVKLIYLGCCGGRLVFGERDIITESGAQAC